MGLQLLPICCRKKRIALKISSMQDSISEMGSCDMRGFLVTHSLALAVLLLPSKLSTQLAETRNEGLRHWLWYWRFGLLYGKKFGCEVLGLDLSDNMLAVAYEHKLTMEEKVQHLVSFRFLDA